MPSIAASSTPRPAPISPKGRAWRRPLTPGYPPSLFLLGVVLCAAASFGLSPVGAATFAGERWAVVIGVSDYDDERLKLRFADRDAEAFKEFLTTPRGGRFV
jgi:hypothetical protein